MIYKIKARIIEDKIGEFFTKLTDGKIEGQEPDGREIVASMQRAVLTEPGVAEWYETCFCSPPLLHERTTQYDHYFTGLTTEEADGSAKVEGESLWTYMQTRHRGSKD
jgi:hypothetical protein